MRTSRVLNIVYESALLMVFGVCFSRANAAEHYLRLGVDVGYARNLAQTNSNGAVGSLDFGYRMAYGHFLLDVGMGGQYLFSRERLQPFTEVQPAVDAEGMSYHRYVSWTERDNDMQRATVSLPLMMGGQWNNFYFLLGVKANLALWGQNQENGVYSVAADYDRYIEMLHSLPQHGLVTNVPYLGEMKEVDMELDVRVVAEVAYKVAATRRKLMEVGYYVGLFAEYGVFNPVAYTPLVIGARITVTWQLKHRPNCMCVRN